MRRPQAARATERLRRDGATYLPYGDAEEGHLDYEPSVLPGPVGG